MNSYVGRTRPARVCVDIGIALRCGCYLSTESWELHIRLLLLNGQAVLTAFQTVLGGQLVREHESVTDRSVTTQVYAGWIGDVQVLGWSTNLQSSFGVSNVLQAQLAETIRRLRDRAHA